MHESEKKLNKRKYLMVEMGKVHEDPSWRRWADKPVGTQRVTVMLAVKHRRASTFPEGSMHHIGWRGGITIQWRYDMGRQSYYAPTVDNLDLTNAASAEILMRIYKVYKDGLYFDTTPEQFIEKMSAHVVEPILREDGCTSEDYHVVRAPGDSPMVTLARQAN